MPFGCKRRTTFLYGAYSGGDSSRIPTSTRGPDVDENNDILKGRRLKRFVKTKIGDNVQIGLCNLTSDVEEEVAMNHGDEE
jgi:hypothetical protein